LVEIGYRTVYRVANRGLAYCYCRLCSTFRNVTTVKGPYGACMV